MNQLRAAQILDHCGTLLELAGENPFRCQAYHNAARALEHLDEDLAELVATGKLASVRGLGDAMVEKITALVRTGQLEFYEELKAKVPSGLVEMLRIPGLGPKKIKALYAELQISTIDELRIACADGRLAALKGFGKKTSEKILWGIDFIAKAGQRYRIDEVLPLARGIFDCVRAHPGVVRAELCGSLRRRKETIQDIDILASSADPSSVMAMFVTVPGVMDVLARGETKSSIVIEPGIQADLRVVTDAQFPFALHYFSGSKEHNVRIRARAQERGLKLNEYELVGDGRLIPCRDEAELFAALDLDYIAPELREDTGEIEAAAEHRLPRLVERREIQGIFHCHTDWSDGSATLEEMAERAKQLGFQYLGIADHSRTAAYAGGLTLDRVREQQRAIDTLAARLPGIRLFKGTESDILADGSLDYPDDLLATFDYVVASVHSGFSMTREDMTRRIIRAVSHPRCTMLGHPTGRLLLRRDGYQVDLDAVIDACARHGTMIEINANPRRLDLDWQHCKRAKARGVRIVINPDAHATDGLDDVHFGVDVARRGWLEAADIVNTRDAAGVAKMLVK